jgi:hypothetical protein
VTGTCLCDPSRSAQQVGGATRLPGFGWSSILLELILLAISHLFFPQHRIVPAMIDFKAQQKLDDEQTSQNSLVDHSNSKGGKDDAELSRIESVSDGIDSIKERGLSWKSTTAIMLMECQQSYRPCIARRLMFYLFF